MPVRDLGLSLVRRLPGLDPLARRVYAALPSALHDTPTARLRRFFAEAEPVSFVQIGAFDGCAGDPIRPLVVERPGWRGVLIEPQPDAFAALLANYGAQASRLDFVEAAVGAQAGEAILYVMAKGELKRLGLPDWIRETASFEREHVRKHAAEGRIDELIVRTLPFAAVASRLPGGIVDLVVIDVEGHEAAVIETIDFDRHGVRFLIYEHKHLGTREAEAVEASLVLRGFSLKRFGRDTAAWRRLLRSHPGVPVEGEA